MTTAKASFAEFLDIAQASGCDGIELRDDLPSALFDGLDPETAASMVRARGLRLLALAEIKAFNHLTAETVANTESLALIASACGAEAIVLIPANDGTRMDAATRKKDLSHSLSELAPILAAHDLLGFVEPLGFAAASLRSKREAVDIIEALGLRDRIKIVHDTFHHFIAGEQEFFPEHTAMVHLSSVVDAEVSIDQLKDSHRVLATNDDRLQSAEQLIALRRGGYTGPASIEAFAAEVHDYSNPVEQLQDSFQFISAGLTAEVA